jgi:hypothetical protein
MGDKHKQDDPASEEELWFPVRPGKNETRSQFNENWKLSY